MFSDHVVCRARELCTTTLPFHANYCLNCGEVLPAFAARMFLEETLVILESIYYEGTQTLWDLTKLIDERPTVAAICINLLVWLQVADEVKDPSGKLSHVSAKRIPLGTAKSEVVTFAQALTNTPILFYRGSANRAKALSDVTENANFSNLYSMAGLPYVTSLDAYPLVRHVLAKIQNEDERQVLIKTAQLDMQSHSVKDIAKQLGLEDAYVRHLRFVGKQFLRRPEIQAVLKGEKEPL